jgi:hypothetical protein
VTAVLRPQQARIRGQLVVYRTDSGQEVRNRRFFSPPILYNSRLPLQDTATATTTATTDYWRRSDYYYYYRLYRGRLCLQSQELREVSFQELIILYKEYQPPPTHLRYIIVIELSIIVFEL